jgi:hypothetical protein
MPSHESVLASRPVFLVPAARAWKNPQFLLSRLVLTAGAGGRGSHSSVRSSADGLSHAGGLRRGRGTGLGVTEKGADGGGADPSAR